MKLLRDPLGRPIKRLYVRTEELDERCEQILAEFMRLHSSGFRLPIPTGEIISMIAADADLDRGAEGVGGCDYRSAVRLVIHNAAGGVQLVVLDRLGTWRELADGEAFGRGHS